MDNASMMHTIVIFTMHVDIEGKRLLDEHISLGCVEHEQDWIEELLIFYLERLSMAIRHEYIILNVIVDYYVYCVRHFNLNTNGG